MDKIVVFNMKPYDTICYLRLDCIMCMHDNTIITTANAWSIGCDPVDTARILAAWQKYSNNIRS